MTDLLKRLGLHDEFQITLPISKSDFTKTLIANLDEPRPGLLDLFSSSKNIYKGKIESDRFEMKRKRKWFSTSWRSLKVYGKLASHNEHLNIDIEVKAFSFALIPLTVVLLLFYGIGFSAMLLGQVPTTTKLLIGAFLIVHAIIMFAIPYVTLKKALHNTRYEFERDLYFMMKDKLHTRS